MICIFCLAFALSSTTKTLPNDFALSKVQVFTNTQSQDVNGFDKIENGAGYVYFCDFKNSKFLISKLNDVEGVTYILDGKYADYLNLKNLLNIKSIEQTDDGCVGFCDYFSFNAFYMGKKVNVQMAFSMNKIYVGSPLILGCY
ncbi:MAG: hypothetical protein IJA69_02140 [Clostridia bacterium]|nr:hypothetical protein [Clostridia bacterium]